MQTSIFTLIKETLLFCVFCSSDLHLSSDLDLSSELDLSTDVDLSSELDLSSDLVLTRLTFLRLLC